MTAPTIPLGSLALGASGTVVGYRDGDGIRRFVEMGFVPGTRVTAVRAAPLGDPIEYAVMGSHVAIRRDDANVVIVREVD